MSQIEIASMRPTYYNPPNIRNDSNKSLATLMNSLRAAFVWGNAGIAQLVQSG